MGALNLFFKNILVFAQKIFYCWRKKYFTIFQNYFANIHSFTNSN